MSDVRGEFIVYDTHSLVVGPT